MKYIAKVMAICCYRNVMTNTNEREEKEMSDYKVIPIDDTVEVIISDAGESEKLTLLEAPPEDSILVQNSRRDVLGEINLDKMLANLEDCVDLLQITFNAVDGIKLQALVQELSKQFSDAVLKSNATALAFKEATATVVDSYILAYGNLYIGETATGIEMLSDVKNVAQKMVKKSDELVSVFEKLGASTNDILKAVMVERAADENKKSEANALIVELEASTKALNQIKQDIQKDIEEFEAEYKRLEKREMDQEKWANGMQIAALVVGGLGSLFGGGSSAFRSKDAASDRREAKESVEGESSAEQNAKEDYAKNIRDQEQVRSSLKKVQDRIEAIDKILDGEWYKDGRNHDKAAAGNPDMDKTGDELREEKQRQVDEKGRLENELKSLDGKEKTLASALEGLGVAVDGISDQIHDTAKEMQAKADSLAERMEVIRKKKDKLRDMERENTMKLAEQTAKMQNAVMDENALESAVKSLVIAIGCLRRVLAYIQEIRLFWMNISTFCDSLASDERLGKMIQSQDGKDAEKSAGYFKTRLFVKPYIETVAKWQSLHVIFTQYLESLAHVAKRLNESFEQSISEDRKKQWQLASQLAGKLKDKLRSEADEV